MVVDVDHERHLTRPDTLPRPSRQPRRPGWRPPPLWTPSRELWTPQNAIGTPTTIGQGGNVATAGSVTFTSSAAVTAGNLVIIFVGWYFTAVTATVSGGGLTWTQHKQQNGVTDTNYHSGVWSAPAPAGVATSTVFTCTFGGGSGGNPMIAGAQCSGLDNASPVDTTGGVNTSGNSTAWASGSVTTTVADTLIVTGVTIDATLTSTTTSPASELHDFQNVAAGTMMTTAYVIKSATGTYSIAGVLSANNNLERVAATVAFKGAGGAAAPSAPVRMHNRVAVVRAAHY